MIHVYHRTWWKENPAWPQGLEPCAGRKTTIDRVETVEEAREICKEWNAEHDPGRLSRKAEFEDE